MKQLNKLSNILSIMIFSVFLLFITVLIYYFFIYHKKELKTDKAAASINYKVEDSQENEELSKTFSIDEGVKEILPDYEGLKKVLVSSNIKVPIENNFVPQGIALYKGYILVSLYDAKYTYNSILYVISSSGDYVNRINLNNKSHVSNISYDEKHEYLWIAGENGVLYVYPAKDLLSKDSIFPIHSFDYISENLSDYQNKEMKNISNIYVNGEYLYVGNFSAKKNIKLKKYKINYISEDKITLEHKKSIKLPTIVQGIFITKYKGKEYLFISRSYKRTNKSTLEVYSFSSKTKDYTKTKPIYTVKMPPMLEQISIKNNYLYAIFESGADKYNDAKDITDFICILDINKMKLK